MITRFLTYFILSICLIIDSKSQDIHFSQFNLAPLNLNPAMTGSFDGDYRIGGNHRNQWSSVTTPYRTFGLSMEKNKFLKEAASAGIQINQDRAGDSRFNTFQINLSGSYLIKFKDTNNFLSLGSQIGFTNRNLDYDPLSFDAQYNGYQYDPSLPNQESFLRNSRTYANFNLGLAHFFDREKLSIQSGIAIFNLTAAKQSFYNDNNIRLDPRLVVHSKGVYNISKKINFLPGLLWMKQGKHKEMILNLETEYILVNFMRTYRSLWAGVSYRNKDALFLTTGMNYDNWKIGLSYDVNISKLVPASMLRGGFEVAIIYIIDKSPIEMIIHRICPDYI